MRGPSPDPPPRVTGTLATFGRVARTSGPLWACARALDTVVPFLGAQRLWRPRIVPAALLARQAASILRAWGLPERHVDMTVTRMLYADLRGIDSHGCCMLPFYDLLRAEGALNPTPEIAVIREDATTALIDGDRGLGHIVATVAMEKAIDKCRVSGVGVAAVRNSGHYGAAGAYAAMAAEHGFIGVATTSTPTPSVVPTFARAPLLGTNPIAIAAPAARSRPFLLDMATSTVSVGKLLDRWRQGRRIPYGWALDDRGRVTRRGRTAARHRRLAPLGGDPEGSSYKGYGLATAVEILSAVLPGIPLRGGGLGRRTEVGHCFLALDPGKFRAPDAFLEDVDSLLDGLRAAEPLDARQPVLVPGDPEQACLARRTASGIPLARGVFEDIRAVALDSGVPFILETGAP